MHKDLRKWLTCVCVCMRLFWATDPLPCADDAGRFSWREEAGAAALLNDGRTIWRFNYSPANTVTYFSPVALPGGADLTWLSPKDHPYHFALFFCWKYLNGLPYWESAPEGVTSWSNVKVATRPDFSALITMDLQYRPRNGVQNVLTERRTIRISSPGVDGSYFMDWHLDFTAGSEPVALDRTPPDPAPDGNPRGGYAGLSLRLSRDLSNPVVAAAQEVGAAIKNRYGFAASGADYSGEIAGRAAGIAFFDHPGNPRFPTRWYAIVDPSVPFWFLNAAVLQPEPYRLAAGQRLILRYRVYVHPGRWAGARLRGEHALYAREAAGAP